MTGSLEYQWHPAVVDDFLALTPGLRDAYLVAIEQIRRDPYVGERLDRRASTGDLSDLRKVRFGHDTERGPSHRIVYRLLPDNWEPIRFRVVAVRSRADVYSVVSVRRRGRE